LLSRIFHQILNLGTNIHNSPQICTSNLCTILQCKRSPLEAAFHQVIHQGFLILKIKHRVPALCFKKRRPCNVKISLFNDFRHLTIKESEKKSSNVAAIHICVSHKNDLVISGFIHVKIIPANAHSKCCN